MCLGVVLSATSKVMLLSPGVHPLYHGQNVSHGSQKLLVKLSNVTKLYTVISEHNTSVCVQIRVPLQQFVIFFCLCSADLGLKHNFHKLYNCGFYVRSRVGCSSCLVILAQRFKVLKYSTTKS